ncbi:MAG TPA: hypothetical protein VLJ11_22490 [Bryobacteraceae bacterium]|nr:hypothetical protein [Bryobacteraceae bacterium]
MQGIGAGSAVELVADFFRMLQSGKATPDQELIPERPILIEEQDGFS